jgi:hypothetical protein
MLGLFLGQGAEHAVDGVMRPARLRRPFKVKQQPVAAQGQFPACRDHVDPVRHQRHPLLGRHDLHGGVAAQHLGQKRRAVGREVHDHHEGNAAVGGHGGKELFQGLLAAGGCADSDDETGACRRRHFSCFDGWFGRQRHIYIF